MKNVWAITKKEFMTYFNAPVAYIVITAFLVLVNWLFFRGVFMAGQANLRPFFGMLPWLFLLFIPAITMRLWAEEKKLGTLELIMTLPVKDIEVVIGKYLASFGFLLVAILLTLSIPFTIMYLGEPDLGPIIGGYLGVIFLGGAYLAIGFYFSSLTEDQIVAFILSAAFSSVFLILGQDFVLYNMPSFLVPVLRYLGLANHFDSIGRGVIDSRDVLYYLSVIFFFLFLNIRSLESRKWK
ncbi:ABC transporter permease [bacterium]|nr:ABC transporter permease [bacterium]